MEMLLVICFVLGYAAIALEHPLRMDKTATALLTGAICWLVLVTGLDHMPVAMESPGAILQRSEFLNEALGHHLITIAEILFFLLGAMTIVELIDAHDGFRVITDRIKTQHAIRLLWIIAWITFFLSAVLDNLTTAIVMCAMLRRIIHRREDQWLFGGFVIIAANAGGAWSPIGDVTTIMLWIGGQVTTTHIMIATLAPSIISLLVPLLLATWLIQPTVAKADDHSANKLAASGGISRREQNMILFLGCLALLSVPVFKMLTHLPPYMGIMLAVGALWYVTEIMHRKKPPEDKHVFSVVRILQRVDTPSILFFLGILLAVAALDTSGHLQLLAGVLNEKVGDIYLINMLIGFCSAIVDNVPLVAASMGMYDLDTFVPDHDFWNLLAYCAGTGGSMLLIGSAAGVASMGILKMDFMWYLRKISLYAMAGYLSGLAVYYVQHQLIW